LGFFFHDSSLSCPSIHIIRDTQAYVKKKVKKDCLFFVEGFELIEACFKFFELTAYIFVLDHAPCLERLYPASGTAIFPGDLAARRDVSPAILANF